MLFSDVVERSSEEMLRLLFSDVVERSSDEDLALLSEDVGRTSDDVRVFSVEDLSLSDDSREEDSCLGE